MIKHSILAPSSSDKWLECAGYASAAILFGDNEDSLDSRIGTAKHWGSQLVLAHGIQLTDLVGMMAPNKITITKDMLPSIEMYTKTVIDVLETFFNAQDTQLKIEHRLDLSFIHPECFGTSDVTGYDSEEKTAHIMDGKFGRVLVEIYKHPQFMLYGLGYVAELEKQGLPVDYIKLHVVQPCSRHIEGSHRVWKLSVAELKAYIPIFQKAAVLALSDNPTYKAGDWCKYCPAIHSCEAARVASISIAQYVTDKAPVISDGYEIGFELRMLREATSLLEARLKAVEGQASELLGRGAFVDGFVGEMGLGNRKWNSEDEDIIAMGDSIGVDLRAPEKVQSPAQAEKIIPDKFVKEFTYRPTKSLKVKPAQHTQAYRIFAKSI